MIEKKPYILKTTDGKEYNVAAPTFYQAAWTAQQEVGDENIESLRRWEE